VCGGLQEFHATGASPQRVSAVLKPGGTALIVDLRRDASIKDIDEEVKV